MKVDLSINPDKGIQNYWRARVLVEGISVTGVGPDPTYAAVNLAERLADALAEKLTKRAAAKVVK